MLAQADPLASATDGADPLRWLPAWRWTRVNDVWSHRGGGLFTAIKNAVLGVLDIGVNMGFFLASLMWEVTTTMLSWALTPYLFAAFEDVVDTAGIRLLNALGFTDAISGAGVFAAVLLMAVVVALMRFCPEPGRGCQDAAALVPAAGGLRGAGRHDRRRDQQHRTTTLRAARLDLWCRAP